MTDIGSTARQENSVGASAFINLVGDLRRGAFVHRFELHRVAHVPDMLARAAANEALCDEIK